ncbi:unnamed protein product [Rotaria magnacalcarata]|uniref:Uncharacterized protein n=2 Tax=Rotaria magnacalcarata TaxID=392030 RepID=A0A816P648_9BILA|nr:unnamed protein product [Rotaria magnacalcarata]CAF3885797.1 unnamed protein product [Rotaria magnacalcarata]CAF5187186.1 unnamed protein product [Rotaria magnacalcarata]
MSKTPLNRCNACKSLPKILSLSKTIQLYESKSLPSCFKFLREQFPNKKKISTLEMMNKNKVNPTIGELLGDDDLFHSHYQHRYSSSRNKRKRYHHRSYSHRKHHRKIQESRYQFSLSSQYVESTSRLDQIYSYPTTYNYTSLASYCYYCYSNMSSYCPYLISNCCNNIRT